MTTKELMWPLSLGTLLLSVLLATAGCESAAEKTMYKKAYDCGYAVGMKAQAENSSDPNLSDGDLAKIVKDFEVEKGTPEYEEVQRGAKEGFRKAYRE